MKWDGQGFLYETHMHTREASLCSGASGREMARVYAAAGYTGIIITNHFFYGNTCVDRSLPWSDWVEGYCKGYENAKEEGDRLGLQVFFGWESGYGGPEFLVYGLDKQWLLDHPEIKDATVEEQLQLVHADGGIISQAHPFREASYIQGIKLYPEYVDAVEILNASHKNPSFNEKARAYAQEYNLPVTAGSDQHHTNMIGGGMVFPRKLTDIHDFANAVMNREAIALLENMQPKW